jgi:hypothetical protein
MPMDGNGCQGSGSLPSCHLELSITTYDERSLAVWLAEPLRPGSKIPLGTQNKNTITRGSKDGGNENDLGPTWISILLPVCIIYNALQRRPMGFTTEFEGRFELDAPLTDEQKKFLAQFAATRRVRRSERETRERPDPVREALQLDVGPEGGYFVGEGGVAGQNSGPGVVDSNQPPTGQPGLWCQWVPTEDGTAIVWDGNEKFYHWEKWLAYIIEHFLGVWGKRLNGEMKWECAEFDERGLIRVNDNEISTPPLEEVTVQIKPAVRGTKEEQVGDKLC